jgi:UDP-glucose 6-dehydrogenase
MGSTSASEQGVHGAVRFVVIGLGHVGELTKRLLEADGHLVAGYDKSLGEGYPAAEAADADFALICVDTPSTDTGAADVRNVRAAVAQVPAGPHVVVRSTVPPGTCAELEQELGRGISHWPEYVGETRFVTQEWPGVGPTGSFVVLGVGTGPEGREFAEVLSHLYGPQAPMHLVTQTESETVKYMENTFFAVKVTFVNEWRRITEALGGDWHRVREAWLADPRVSRDHSLAFAQLPGFSGKCLPKDLAAAVAFGSALGMKIPLMEGTLESNEVSAGD